MLLTNRCVRTPVVQSGFIKGGERGVWTRSIAKRDKNRRVTYSNKVFTRGKHKRA